MSATSDQLALSRLRSYLPRFICERLSQMQAPPSTPFADTLPAVILMADVAGFTKLSEELAQLGALGIERLSAALNTYFGRLINILDEYGGDVLRFAGDAPIVLFCAQQDEELAQVALRATHCALELQEALNNYPVADTLRLSMRICLTMGTVVAAVVGGKNGRWEFLIGGPPLSALSELLPQGQPGEVLASHPMWQMIAPFTKGEDKPYGVRIYGLSQRLTAKGNRPGIVQASFAALSPLVPHNVLRLVETNNSLWVAESRRVTTLFISIEGITITGPEILDLLQAALLAVQTGVYHYDGSLNQFLVDDKGLTVVALWGVPCRTHEDDPSRAVRAALEVEELLIGLGLRCSAGITVGRVFCGHRGNDSRREYSVIGTSVNLAARLMARAAKLSSPSPQPSPGEEAARA